MTKQNQKNILVLFGTLLFTGFLFSLPWGTYAADPVFTAGYYRDEGTAPPTAPCGPGFWQAHIEVKGYDEKPLVADTIIVQPIFYAKKEDGTHGDASPLLPEPIIVTNATSLETLCEIPTRAGEEGRISLYVQVGKAGYHDMIAANPAKENWALNQKKLSKTIYLAQLGDGTEVNFAFLSPAIGEWISETSTIQVKVNKPAGMGDINKIEMRIQDDDNTGPEFTLDSGDIKIASGTVPLSLPQSLIEQGEQGNYTWALKLMRSGTDIFYNEKIESSFNFDSLPPRCHWVEGWGSREYGSNEQALIIKAIFVETENAYVWSEPGSGMGKVEFYYNNTGVTPLKLTYTDPGGGVHFYYRTYVVEETRKVYDETETFTVSATGYDRVGHKTACSEKTATIYPLKESELTISSEVSLRAEEGVPFEIISVDPAGAGVPTPGGYTTTETFYGSYDYTITLGAPDEYEGKPFSFWFDPRQNNVDCRRLSTTTSLTISLPGLDWTPPVPERMYFGITHLNFQARGITNASYYDTYYIDTKITQEGGTPLLLPMDGLPAKNWNFIRTEKKIENLVLEAHDSDDGLLKFSGWDKNPMYGGYFCEPDLDNPRQCKGLSVHKCGSVRPLYLLNRMVKVEVYKGDDELVGGVNVGGEAGMATGTTETTGPTKGYYTFSSTGTVSEFSGTLWATTTILNPDGSGNQLAFDKWVNCQNQVTDFNKCASADKKCGCVIGGITWSENATSVTVGAHYAGEAEATNHQLDVVRGGTGSGEGKVTGSGIDCSPGPELCSKVFNEGDSVTLTAATTTASAEFDSWDWFPAANCGAAGDTLTCTMDSDINATATFDHIGPTAAMECDPDNNLVTRCGGPGCVCDNVNPVTWVTFDTVPFRVINISTPAADIVSSTWSLTGGPTNIERPCILDPLCDFTIGGVATGTYNIILEVEDSVGFPALDSHSIRVKQDIIPNFKCSLAYSLDPLDYDDCEDDTKIAPLTGQTVYFMDTSMVSEGGGSIAAWEWKKGKESAAISDFEPFGPNSMMASTTLTTATNTVYLKVQDGVPRSDWITKTLKITLPLPEYRPVAPIGRLDNFLAKLANAFARF